MDITIILAAGEGTRMKSKKSKVLHKIANKSLIDYVLDSSIDAGSDKTVIIAGKNKNELEEIFNDKVIYKEQKIGKDYPYGTGYAVQLAVDEFSDDDNVMVLNGDTPLIKGDTLRFFLEKHKESHAKASVLTAFIDDTTGYGHIIKDQDGNLVKIVEDKDANIDEKKVKEFLAQENLGSLFLVNLTAGKSWRIKGKYVSVFASVNNLLNKQFKTGRFEQARRGNYQAMVHERANGYPTFGNKYFVGYGTSYYVNMAISF